MPVSEANASEQLIPEGWYDDPASPQMQRWWTGSDWTDHVRYSDTVRLQAVAPPVATLTTTADAGFDDFYIPMRGFSGSASIGTPPAARRRSAQLGWLWLLGVAVVGMGAGVAVWVLLP